MTNNTKFSLKQYLLYFFISLIILWLLLTLGYWLIDGDEISLGEIFSEQWNHIRHLKL